MPPQGISFFNKFLRQPDNSPQDPISNNLDPANPSYPYGSILLNWLIASGIFGTSIRTLLTSSPSNFYISDAGNDSNPGTAGQPWLTEAPFYSRYDAGGQDVILNLLTNRTRRFQVKPWVGGGTVTLDGANHTINYTGVDTFDGAIDAKYGAPPGPFRYQNIKLTTSLGASGQCALVNVQSPAVVDVGTGTELQAANASPQLYAATSGFIRLTNSFNVSGGAGMLILADVGGVVSTLGVPITTAFLNNVTYSQATVFADHGALVVPFSVNWDLQGHTVTGQRFTCNTGANIVALHGLQFIPGTVEGVQTAPGGGYV